MKRLARYLVEKVPGLHRVLEIICFPYEITPSEEIRRSILSRLAICPTCFERVQVSVSRGRVTVRGTVRTIGEKLSVVARAYVDGVRCVDSRGLHIDLAQQSQAVPPSDDAIKKIVELAMAHGPNAISRINVSVKDGLVLLTGESANSQTKAVAESLVLEVPGVKVVQNKLTVHASRIKVWMERCMKINSLTLMLIPTNYRLILVCVGHYCRELLARCAKKDG